MEFPDIGHRGREKLVHEDLMDHDRTQTPQQERILEEFGTPEEEAEVIRGIVVDPEPEAVPMDSRVEERTTVTAEEQGNTESETTYIRRSQRTRKPPQRYM